MHVHYISISLFLESYHTCSPRQAILNAVLSRLENPCRLIDIPSCSSCAPLLFRALPTGSDFGAFLCNAMVCRRYTLLMPSCVFTRHTSKKISSELLLLTEPKCRHTRDFHGLSAMNFILPLIATFSDPSRNAVFDQCFMWAMEFILVDSVHPARKLQKCPMSTVSTDTR